MTQWNRRSNDTHYDSMLNFDHIPNRNAFKINACIAIVQPNLWAVTYNSPQFIWAVMYNHIQLWRDNASVAGLALPIQLGNILSSITMLSSTTILWMLHNCISCRNNRSLSSALSFVSVQLWIVEDLLVITTCAFPPSWENVIFEVI